MNRLEKLVTHIFPSDASVGRIGSLDMNIWLAQITGVPLLGLKAESRRQRNMLIFYGFIMIPLVNFLYTGFEMYDLILNWNNLDAVTQNACLSLSRVAGIFKILNTFYRLQDIQNLMKKLKQVTKEFVNTEKQRRSFIRGEIENKLSLTIMVTLIGSTALVAVVLMILYPYGLAGEVFPYRAKLPEWVPHKLKLAYMGFCLVFTALQIVSMDYLNIAMINQIRYHLDILIVSFDEIESNSLEPPFVPIQQLKRIVEYHCALMELRNEIEHIYRFPVLLQFGISFLISGLTGFRATVTTGGGSTDVIIYLYCGCIFFELFFYCWFGNEVFEKSKSLSLSGFSFPWYNLDSCFRKSLLIFIANAQRPFLFTAGGVMGLYLPSFSGILGKAYSFIALLRQFYAKRY